MVKHGKALESMGKLGTEYTGYSMAQYRIVRMVQHSTSWYSMVSIVKSITAR
jgi:hypothetical protein